MAENRPKAMNIEELAEREREIAIDVVNLARRATETEARPVIALPNGTIWAVVATRIPAKGETYFYGNAVWSSDYGDGTIERHIVRSLNVKPVVRGADGSWRFAANPTPESEVE